MVCCCLNFQDMEVVCFWRKVGGEWSIWKVIWKLEIQTSLQVKSFKLLESSWPHQLQKFPFISFVFFKNKCTHQQNYTSRWDFRKVTALAIPFQQFDVLFWVDECSMFLFPCCSWAQLTSLSSKDFGESRTISLFIPVSLIWNHIVVKRESVHMLRPTFFCSWRKD